MATGIQVYELGLTRLGCKYRLGALVPKNDPNYLSEFDCAELTSWVVYQLTGKLYGCSNNNGNPATADAYTGFWKRDADLIGKIVSVEQGKRTKGAFLLRYSGSGVVGHIVISDGNHGTVEAHSTKKGLIKSTSDGRRWDIAILPPYIDYTIQQPSKPTEVDCKPSTTIYRWTSPLMKGDKVELIQLALLKKGYFTNVKEVDGLYGSKTFYAVRAFQNKAGIVPDGEVGAETAKLLGIKL